MECLVRSVSLNNIDKSYDGQWQGIAVASDGKCYFGSSTHSPVHGATFFRFDPETEKLDNLAEDITRICGEDPIKNTPQGKIHSPIVECDGWLYFSSHLAIYTDDEAMRDYTGAHMLGYELATGKFRDLGVVRKRHSVYSAINVDKVNKKIYAFVVPFAKEDLEEDSSHFYQIDIKTGEMTDLGLVPEKGRGSCLGIFVDDRGDCWFTLFKYAWHESFDEGGDLYQYDSKKNKINCYKNVLPFGKYAPNGTSAPEELNTSRSWVGVDALTGNKKCIFTMGHHGGGDERLWIFDPRKNIASGEAFESVGFIGSTFLSVAHSNGRCYYVQFKNLDDARNYWTETIRDKDIKELDFENELHLRSISIESGNNNIIDHGKIVDQDKRIPILLESLAVDDKGNVFIVGGWYSLSPDEATVEYPDKVLKRGQFFSFGNISEDIK
jgi:hypothetical protein